MIWRICLKNNSSGQRLNKLQRQKIICKIHCLLCLFLLFFLSVKRRHRFQISLIRFNHEIFLITSRFFPLFYHFLKIIYEKIPRDVQINDIVVSEFELQLHNCIHFQSNTLVKWLNLYLRSDGFNGTTLGWLWC